MRCRTTCAVLRPLAHLAGAVGGGRVVTSVRTPEPLVALTVDDGPAPATTPALLDVLDRHGAHATFFLIGERAARHPELVRRIADDGHELGNHLLRDEPSVRLSAAEFARQLDHVHALLAPHVPPERSVRFFRPGSGWFTPRMLGAASARGYGCAMGSPWLVTARYRTPAGTGRRLAARAHAGAVVVLHEGTSERAPVAATADALLTGLGELGYRATTLSDLCARET